MEKYLNFVKVILDRHGNIIRFEALPNEKIKSVVVEIKSYLLDYNLDNKCFTFVMDGVKVPISLNLSTPDIIQNYYNLCSEKANKEGFLLIK